MNVVCVGLLKAFRDPPSYCCMQRTHVYFAWWDVFLTISSVVDVRMNDGHRLTSLRPASFFHLALVRLHILGTD